MIPLHDLFDIRYGHSLELNRQRLLSLRNGGIPFVSRTSINNGISAYIEPIKKNPPEKAGVLTVALGGAVMSTFLQETAFYSGRDVAHLHPKIAITKQQLLFYCACLIHNRYRFSYGRQANRTLKNILIPALTAIPNYVELANVKRFDGCDKSAEDKAPNKLNVIAWKPFLLGKLFVIKKGKRLTKANMKNGTTPFIGSTDSNNGTTAFVGQSSIHSGNTISLSYNGSVAEAFFQPVPFWATDDVNVLYPRFSMTTEIALFICTILRMEKYRYNYGRKWHMERMRESIIKLPAISQYKPNFALMEQYIKRLPYSSQIQ